ncbi:tRNA (adenosine(37)-N6)-threonylcarbamoyltransferase complex transferase subunit TsaD, partial [Patescibacteria group bacterium]|nr:tRNA (adenosine(37)-N6)-threonylcarbamoyltransferase complex transferase subunit TsaD [Patescibacteria group bacterium]
IAGRMHAEKIVPLVEEVLNSPSPLESPLGQGGKNRPDVIAVTAGPGLITGLVVGVEAARTLSYAWNIPLVAVNHIEGHVHSVEITNSKFQISNNPQNSNHQKYPTSNIQYPALALIVSGGHTELIYIKKQGSYKVIGKTKDDAAGECFDKVAKLLDLPYPGGPQISQLALKGNPQAINFPRPMINEKIDFSSENEPAFGWSFSGLKTSALYWLRDHKLAAMHLNHIRLPAGFFAQMPEPPTLEDFCASFEQAIIDVLVAKTLKAAEEYKPKTVILGGGVSANVKLRSTLETALNANLKISNFLFPMNTYCMDNAAMIATAGYYKAVKKEFADWRTIKADPNWEIE